MTHAEVARAATLSGLLFASSFSPACGRTVPLDEFAFEGGSGAKAGGDGAQASGGASGASGTSGSAGLGTGGSGASAADAGPRCHLPEVPAPPDPTPQELERARLMRDYCITLIRQGCLDRMGASSFISRQTIGCSSEERIVGCQQDRLYDYLGRVAPACDYEWQAAIQCLTATDFDDKELCAGADLYGGPVHRHACSDEKRTLETCIAQNSDLTTISGTRATCSVGIDGAGTCGASCLVGTDTFMSSCGSPPGSPVRCSCEVNGHVLGGGAWSDRSFHEESCEDTGQRMADGEWCTNHLDCCLEYEQDGTKRCDCGTVEGCEEARKALGGTPVDRCSKYHSMF
jgi:hypothetical protein